MIRTIRQKFVFFLSIMAVLIIGMGAFGVFTLNRLNTGTGQIGQQYQSDLVDGAAVESGLLLHSLKVNQYLATGNRTNVSDADDLLEQVSARLVALEQRARTASDLQLVRGIRKDYEAYRVLSAGLQALYEKDPGDTVGVNVWRIGVASLLENNLRPKVAALTEARRQDTHELDRVNGYQVWLYTWSVAGLGLLAIFLVIALAILSSRSVMIPLRHLTEVTYRVAGGDLTARALVGSADEFNSMAAGLNLMTDQMQARLDLLQDQVKEPGRRLELLALLSEHLNASLNPAELPARVIDLVKENFGYHRAQLYLLDEKGQNLVMAASDGSIGMVAQAPATPLPLAAPTSLVAQAARSGEAIIVDDVNQTPDWLNPHLPQPHAELVIPIMSKQQLLGVLAVQAEEVAGLAEGDVTLLRLMANQVAVALQNGRLLQKTQADLDEAMALNRQLTRQAWETRRNQTDTAGYVFTKVNVGPGAEWLPPMARAVQEKTVAYGEGDRPAPAGQISSLAVPLTLRGEVIGVIGIERAAPVADEVDAGWSEDELVTVQNVTEQIALALDAARLARETQRAAWRDRVVSEATARVWSSAEIEEVMKAAVTQLGEKLRASEVVLRLGTELDLALEPAGDITVAAPFARAKVNP